MQINKISQAMQGELRKVEGSRRHEAGQPVAKAGAADRSELSADGKKQREIRGEMQIISAMIGAQPDVRSEKVAEARARVGAGFYDTGAFAEKLASRLAAALM